MKHRYAILATVLLFTAMGSHAQQQTEFPIGVYMWAAPNVNADFSQMKNDLHLTWVSGIGREWGTVNHEPIETNPAGLKVISARLPHMYMRTRTQQLWIEAEKNVPTTESDYTYPHFRRYPSTGTQTGNNTFDPSAWTARLGIDQPGYIASDLSPDDQYFWNQTHFTATFRLKVIKSQFSTDEPIVRLTAFCTTHNTALNERELYDWEFDSSSVYRVFELAYDVQATCDHPPSALPMPAKGGLVPLHRCTSCNVDMRVWWYGTQTCWLERVVVEDDAAYALFPREGQTSGSLDGEIVQDAADYETGYPLVKRFYAFDEPPINAFRGINYVDQLIANSLTLDPNNEGRGRLITAQYNIDNYFKWFVQDAQPREILQDNYVITENIPSPSMTDAQAQDVGVAAYNKSTYDSRVLWAIEYLDAALKQAVLYGQGKNSWFVPQLHGIYKTETDAYWTLRPPTGTEIHAMINSAVAFGVKGIMGYAYGTYHWTNEPPPWPDSYQIGLVSEYPDSDGVFRDHYSDVVTSNIVKSAWCSIHPIRR